MKFDKWITTIAAAAAIATYVGFKPNELKAEQPKPTFNIQGNSGNGNVQIQNNGSINMSARSSQSLSTLECPKENLYVTKSGYYGAANPKRYLQMDNALQTNDQKTLEKLLFEHLIIALPPGTPTCVQAIAHNWYRKQILLPNNQITYWVSDRAIEKVE